MKRMVCLVAVAALFLSGCRAQSETGDQVIVTGIGIEKLDERWQLSIQAVEALRISGSLSEQNESATTVYTAVGNSVAEALQAFLNETGKRAYILQNQVLAIGLDQCRAAPLQQTLDYFLRNREAHAQVQLVVCRGQVAPLLNITAGNDAIPAEYVSQMLAEGNRVAECVTAQLVDIERDSADTVDAVLPIVEVTDGVPRLSGTALFHHGRFLGELSNRETTALLLAMGESATCLYKQNDTAYQLEDLRSHIRVLKHDAAFEYHVTVSGVSRTVEQGGPSTSLAEAEATLAFEIRTTLERVAQELQGDPLGLARRAAAQSGVEQNVAREMLPHSRITVSVSLTHADNGLIA